MNNQNKLARLFTIIFGLVGLVLLIPGIILLCIYGASGDMDFLISGGVLSGIGGIFSIIAACGIIIARGKKKKIEHLMSDGICYDAEISRTYENLYMNINYRHPIIVECTYKDNNGVTYLVKSGNIWPDRLMPGENDIKAKVWVNPNDPKDYFVEVSFGQDKISNKQFDYDLR